MSEVRPDRSSASAPGQSCSAGFARETAFHRGGTGAPLLLLHGASITWRTWKPVLPLLEPHHDVIAPTLVGHSGGPVLADGTPISIDALVNGVITTLDGLGIERAHVAGNSLGGWVALELARRQRALSVTAFSPGGAWRSNVRYGAMMLAMEQSLKLLDVFGDRTDQLLASPRLRNLFARVACQHPERLDPVEFAADLRALRSTPVLRNLMRAISATPVRPLPDPDCPIRIVWARKDRVVPYRHFGAPLLERLPTAHLVMLNGVGHVPMIDDPRAVAAQILDVTGGSSNCTSSVTAEK